MGQDNTLRKQSLVDLTQMLTNMGDFREVGQTLKSPEEIKNYPVAYVLGGSGPRVPVDTQQVHFDHEAKNKVYLFVREVNPNLLAGDLEDIVLKVLDKIGDTYSANQTQHEYNGFVSEIDTDEGAIASTGLKIAMAVLTITLQFPAADK